MHMFGGGKMVSVVRDVKAVEIPAGSMFELKQGTHVFITQVLGGMFTVETEYGFLARVDGKDADALGEEIPPERQAISNDTDKSTDEMVWEQLRTCYDPEIPVNIVELGLVYEVKVTGPHVDVQMTLTAPGCGMGEVLKTDIEAKLIEVPGIQTATVEILFDPPWDSSMMSESARLHLGML